MTFSLLAVEVVLGAFRDLLILDSGMDSVESSVVVELSASPLYMYIISGWHMGTVGCWRHSMVGRVILLLAAASMVVMYFCSVRTDSYIVNLNHFWCCFG